MGATIIDALVVELGLDTKTLTANQRQAIDSFKKTQDAAKKAGDDIEKRAASAAEGLEKVAKAAFGIFAAFTAGRGIRDFVEGMTDINANLGRTEKLIDDNAHTLGAWRGAATLVGGTADATTNSIAGLIGQFQQFSVTGNSSVIPYFRALGVHISDTEGKMRPFQDIMLDLADRFSHMDPARAAFFGQALGLDKGTINLLIQGRSALAKMLEDQKKYAPTASDIAAAQKLQESFANLELASTRLGTTLLTRFKPSIDGLTKALTKLGDWLQQHPDTLTAIAGGLAAIGTAITVGLSASAIGIALSGLGGLFDILGALSSSELLLGLAALSSTVLPGLSEAFFGLALAIEATPIGWILLGVALLIVAGYELIAHWNRVRDWWDGMWGDMAKSPARVMAEFAQFVVNPAGWLGSKIAGAVGAAMFGTDKPVPGAGGGGGGGDKGVNAEAWAAAQATERQFGIPAKVTYAQWALESNYGRRMPAGSNNPFGIKATGDQDSVSAATTEYIGGQAMRTTGRFAKFGSLQEAFAAHARLLATSPRYAGARQFEGDPSAFANALTGVYATDPSYGAKLNSIMGSMGGAPTSAMVGASGQVADARGSGGRNVQIGTINVDASNAKDAPATWRSIGTAADNIDIATQSNGAPA